VTADKFRRIVGRMKEAGLPWQGENGQGGSRSEGVYPRLRWKKPFRLKCDDTCAKKEILETFAFRKIVPPSSLTKSVFAILGVHGKLEKLRKSTKTIERAQLARALRDLRAGDPPSDVVANGLSSVWISRRGFGRGWRWRISHRGLGGLGERSPRSKQTGREPVRRWMQGPRPR